MSKYTESTIRAVLVEHATASMPFIAAGKEPQVDLGIVTDAANAKLYGGARRLLLQDVEHIVARYQLTSYNGVKRAGWPRVSKAVSRPSPVTFAANSKGV